MDSSSSYYKDVICNIIADHIGQMSPYILSKVIWGLSDCEICWDQLPLQIQWYETNDTTMLNLSFTFHEFSLILGEFSKRLDCKKIAFHRKQVL